MSFEQMDTDFSEENTLNEPILTTVMRDVSLVGRRLWMVMQPYSSNELAVELRRWELWGCLIISMSLATLLSFETDQEASSVFSLIFLVYFLGAGVVTIQMQLLGATLNFFQTLCLLGYCVFPILVSALANLVWKHLPGILAALLMVLTAAGSCFWSMRAASMYLEHASYLPEGRKTLALYPMLLFYLTLTWMVLIGSLSGFSKPAAPSSTVPNIAPQPAVTAVPIVTTVPVEPIAVSTPNVTRVEIDYLSLQ